MRCVKRIATSCTTTASPRRCVIKQGRRGATMGTTGGDARDRVRHEAAILARLPADPRFPALYDVVEQDGDLFLVIEDVEGQTLGELVWTETRQGRMISDARLPC